LSPENPDPTKTPVPTFQSFGLHPDLMRGITDMQFETPTPIQAIAIPPLMQGRDVLAAAATGSGKTAAFLLPVMHRLLALPRGTTRVLVLAPTREQAAQIAEHMEALARHTGLKGAAVFGGVGMQPQVDAFKAGVDVIVACPGRLLDHMQHDYARLAGLDVLVLDEADRMLDMGFLPDVKRVLAALPPRRHTMLFSATMPQPIVDLSRQILKDPVPLNIHRKSAPAKGITHAVYAVPGDLKTAMMVELLNRTRYDSVLVFTRTKHRANRLADLLEKKGVKCTRIHGNRSQTRRTEAMQGFKAGDFRVMVATDIAARGIDVEELALVVNFDLPHVPEDYIHRVGRTARADCTGVAISLVSPEEEDDLRAIERHMGVRLPRQRLDGFDLSRRPDERFEIPIAERIAEIRKRRGEERLRAKANQERREAAASMRARQEAEAAARRAGNGRAGQDGRQHPLPQQQRPQGQRPPVQPARHPQGQHAHGRQQQRPQQPQAQRRDDRPAPRRDERRDPRRDDRQPQRQEPRSPRHDDRTFEGTGEVLFRWRSDQRRPGR
jgi:ATP-dependent RNA helicase RhlE